MPLKQTPHSRHPFLAMLHGSSTEMLLLWQAQMGGQAMTGLGFALLQPPERPENQPYPCVDFVGVHGLQPSRL